MQFPDYIVADEGPLSAEDKVTGREEHWRQKRSTMQLFVVREGKSPRPIGPAHAEHDVIAQDGNGAFSHYRDNILLGPHGKSHLRFSTPGNVPLDDLESIIAVAFRMTPPMGWIEFPEGKKKKHQEVFREMFFRTFPTVGVEPHVISSPKDARSGVSYMYRIGGNHEFELPLRDGEIYEKRLPHQLAEWYGQFEQRGGILFPPPASYVFYQNKVALTKLFKKVGVKTPFTWVFKSVDEAVAAQHEIVLPVVIKDPYGFSSHGIRQAKSVEEFVAQADEFFRDVGEGVEAIVQSKVVALKEARVSYIDGRPFHAYWRIRKSLDSASAASNLGGYQSFDFPLPEIAETTAQFAKQTGVPVGGVDWIWEEKDPDVRAEPYTLEVSPTSDLNPPSPKAWTKTYAEFKDTDQYRPAYLAVRRLWCELMTIAAIDRFRRGKRHLFVDVDNTVSLSSERVRRFQGKPEAYTASEVMKDKPVPGAANALQLLRRRFFVRFLAARGNYQDAFNTTQTWLDTNGFHYDDLVVVSRAMDKLAYLSPETLLVDDMFVGFEKEAPHKNEKFVAELDRLKLPYVTFPLGGTWKDVMPQIWREGSPEPAAGAAA